MGGDFPCGGRLRERPVLKSCLRESELGVGLHCSPHFQQKDCLIDHSRAIPTIYCHSMRALVYTAPEKVAIENRERPAAVSGEIEIAVQMAGICGSDISGFLGHSALRRPPIVLGHEMVGWLSDGRRVVANPLVSCSACDACLAGQQNLCVSWRLLGLGQTQGTFAEFVALPSAQVHEIPQSLSSPRAVMAEPLANLVHLYRVVSPPSFFRLAIVGAGTIGILALLVGKLVGAQDVALLDVNENRLATGRKLGARTAINTGVAEGFAEVQSVAERGFDLVVDASGSAAARQIAFDLCRAGGTVALLGMGAQKSEINFVASIRKEHRVVMSFAYTPVDFRRALDLLIGGEINIDPWTELMPLEQGQQAFERMSRAPGSTLKMLLEVTPAR
jgi:threonine dehydrogenase-like Zn-dependent dehydrogenase